MGPEFAALVARVAGGQRVNVRAECAVLGVSAKTFYKYLARFRAEGVEGFYPRSRRPLTSPARLSVAAEDALVRARKEPATQAGTQALSRSGSGLRTSPVGGRSGWCPPGPRSTGSWSVAGRLCTFRSDGHGAPSAGSRLASRTGCGRWMASSITSPAGSQSWSCRSPTTVLAWTWRCGRRSVRTPSMFGPPWSGPAPDTACQPGS